MHLIAAAKSIDYFHSPINIKKKCSFQKTELYTINYEINKYQSHRVTVTDPFEEKMETFIIGCFL